jgi:hypothetical protein
MVPELLIPPTVMEAEAPCPGATEFETGVMTLVPPVVWDALSWKVVVEQPAASRFVICALNDAVLPGFTQIVVGVMATDGACATHPKDTWMRAELVPCVV